VRGTKLTDLQIAHKLQELKSSFDRTFQEALVERSQDLAHLLTIRIGTAKVALNVGDLAGLVRAQTIVPLPTAIPGLLGVAGLKGRMVVVYSLAVLIGNSTQSTETDRWLVLCRSEERIALAFTAAEGTLMLPTSDLHPVGPEAPPHATASVGSGSSSLWLLNVNSIIAAILRQTATSAVDL
jgi:chemotaxis signal transduction protein